MDSLLSIVQMPAGIPVGTLAIGRAGAVNAALLAASILAGRRPGRRRAAARLPRRADAGRARQPRPGRVRRPGDPRVTLVACIGGGQLGRMLGLAGIPLGLVVPLPRPRGRRLRAGRGRARRRRVRRSGGARAPGGRGGRRHLRVRERAGRGGCAASARCPGSRPSSAGRTGCARRSCSARSGIPTARFGELEETGVPALVKTRRLGYDGKGQRRVERSSPSPRDELAEELVPFDRELSIVGVRGRDGETRFWPVGENVHRDGHPSRHPRPRPGCAAGGGGGDLHDAPRRPRLRRRARRRALRGRRAAARERVRAARAQHRALDDRRRRHEPVREPPASDPRSAARRDRGDGAGA